MEGKTEAAVEKLAAVIRALSVEGTVARLAKLAESARAAQQALTEDFDALDTAANALLKLMEEQHGRLAQETQDVVEAVAAALNGVEEDAQAMKTAAEQTAGALEALDSAAGILTVNLPEQLVTRADEPAANLATQVDEAATALDRTLVGLLQAMGDVVKEELGGARKEEIEKFGQRAQAAALKDAQRLSIFFEEWAGRIAGAADQVKNKTLPAAAAHPETAVAALMESCATEHREAFALVAPVLASVNSLLAELQGDVVRVDGMLAEQLPELPTMSQALETALTTSVTDLQASATFLRAALGAQ